MKILGKYTGLTCISLFVLLAGCDVPGAANGTQSTSGTESLASQSQIDQARQDIMDTREWANNHIVDALTRNPWD